MDPEAIAVQALKEIAKLEGDAVETAVKALAQIASTRVEPSHYVSAEPLRADAPGLIG
jgi:hypothetical protein